MATELVNWPERTGVLFTPRDAPRCPGLKFPTRNAEKQLPAGTFDLSANFTVRPASRASGNILAADGSTVIGTYSVVTSAIPEPATDAVVMGPIVLEFAFFRRKRKSFA